MNFLISILALVMSAVPLALGWGAEQWAAANHQAPSYLLLLILVLVLWLVFSWLVKYFLRSTGMMLFLLHFLPGLSMVLLGVQELGLGYYWATPLGNITRLFYAAMRQVQLWIPGEIRTTFSGAFVSFLLLLLVSAIGSTLTQGRRPKEQHPKA